MIYIPDLLPLYFCHDESIQDSKNMTEKIRTGFSLVGFNRIKRHFFQILTLDRMKVFRESDVKSLQKLDYSKYKALCS